MPHTNRRYPTYVKLLLGCLLALGTALGATHQGTGQPARQSMASATHH